MKESYKIEDLNIRGHFEDLMCVDNEDTRRAFENGYNGKRLTISSKTPAELRAWESGYSASLKDSVLSSPVTGGVKLNVELDESFLKEQISSDIKVLKTKIERLNNENQDLNLINWKIVNKQFESRPDLISKLGHDKIVQLMQEKTVGEILSYE